MQPADIPNLYPPWYTVGHDLLDADGVPFALGVEKCNRIPRAYLRNHRSPGRLAEIAPMGDGARVGAKCWDRFSG